MIPVAGKLSDTYSKKKVLLTLFIIYIIGIVAAGLSNNIYFLIAARMLQGFSIASIPVAFSIIRDILPVKKLDPYLSVDLISIICMLLLYSVRMVRIVSMV